ncbi:MAG: ABC transporter ATP-binding protein [Gallionellales bacterium RIFCSPLOWO2_12_FULL_57_18]|nr:MAG: ABC transporter ATP-binding protein [Gallionellales bacterium RIFCSPLOWO2_12_FULL_57_18]OGS96275.1 MAG: ABC transporter ATP-binding protein [Gallionellales bacterium RIFCSPLOWO2_02_FULL_57_47]OGT18037.1 MAG: ABC transporter ATP-binding protein [Gallionellales bacterium RIFCSPHIGHO2_02_FULL_57_16]
MPNATPSASQSTGDITLSARNLTRSFGNRQVVHNVSLELRRGEVLGLLGHNGAGKSTTLQMLAGCLLPDSAEKNGSGIDICGIDLLRHPALAKAHIGYLPENPPLYRELSVNNYLTFAARLRGMKPAAAAEALAQTRQRCGLEGAGDKIIGTLSKGYQQRIGIAQAIIHRPAVIVLDEPTIGLDPTQIREIRSLIRELGDAHSVILSTHLLSEVESVCDRVDIMQQGRLIYSDTSEHMQQHGSVSGFIISLRNPPPPGELEAIDGVSSVEQLSATQFRVLHTPDANPGGTLVTLAERHGWQLEQLTPLQATLEEVFVKITAADMATTAPARSTPVGTTLPCSDSSSGETT